MVGLEHVPNYQKLNTFYTYIKMVISYRTVLKAWVLFGIKTSHISYDLHTNKFFRTYNSVSLKG